MNTVELNNEILNEEVIDEVVDSEDFQEVLDAEQAAFEEGIDDDDPDLDMDEEDINQQTLEFLKLRGKGKE